MSFTSAVTTSIKPRQTSGIYHTRIRAPSFERPVDKSENLALVGHSRGGHTWALDIAKLLASGAFPLFDIS